MAPRKNNNQIVTTDTQLFAMLERLEKTRDKADDTAHEDIKTSLSKLGEKVDKIDTAIRGNGDPGIKQDLALVRKDVDDHLEDTKDTTMAFRWKIGIILAVLLALIPAANAVHQFLEPRAPAPVTTREIVLEVLREVVVEKNTK